MFTWEALGIVNIYFYVIFVVFKAIIGYSV